MTHSYKITGMTCGGCEASVKKTLLQVAGVTGAEVSKDKQAAEISMDGHISLSTFQQALPEKYVITTEETIEPGEEAKSWLNTYKPILLIFGYITVISIIGAYSSAEIHLMKGMIIFMAGFFLTFSFFKLLDLRGFSESYAMYDVLAKKFKPRGFIYPFIELALGISYATGFEPIATNIVTLIVMTISIIGVLQSVLKKQTIKCACLGAVFNLPMSTVTIIEDAIMIVMSVGMIFALV